ncbi:ROK family transcriptional regulator [Phaeobacter sp. JH20_36]|uniref:ROK family transcriptional regulator n=1 Tax=unclassified Phaeobacter TaxID=2621772 RepID=UPI003A879244
MESTQQTSFSRQVALYSVMQDIIHCGPISRASISKQTGLSKQTVSELVRILEGEGWIRETGRTSGHVGRTATTYELIPESAFMAAVDLGGTKVRVAIVDLAGTIVAEVVAPTHPDGGRHVADQIGDLVSRAIGEGNVAANTVRQTVVGCPGVPDVLSGKVNFAPNIAGIDQIDFRAAVSEATGTKTLLENDVNLAVLGEHWLGAGHGIDNVALIAFGTGVGAGLIVNGALVRGASGAAGELGYLPFGADPFEEESLRVGAFERVSATHGIRAAYLATTGKDVDVPAIFDAAASGEVAAREVLDKVATQMARAVAAIGAVVAPEVVILGGAIGSRPEILTATRDELKRCFPFPIRIEPAQLGHHAALSGAVAVGLTELHTELFAKSAPGAVITLPTPKQGKLAGSAE